MKRENDMAIYTQMEPPKINRALPAFIHKFYAQVAGYFWLSCPNCGQKFGGHEVDGHAVKFVYFAPGKARMLCPSCSHMVDDDIVLFVSYSPQEHQKLRGYQAKSQRKVKVRPRAFIRTRPQ